MKFEFSAGGVVFKQAGGKVYVLLCQHSANHKWVFPKGLIGDTNKGEKKEETAIREVKEETGVDAKIIEPLPPITFWYKFNGELIKKTVYYYLMEYVSGDITDHDFEMETVEWVQLDGVKNRLSHKSDKELFQEARKRLEKLVGSS